MAERVGLPVAWLVAIRATETGGTTNAVRFEPHLFAKARPDDVARLQHLPVAEAHSARLAAWAAGKVPYTRGLSRAASDSREETDREAFERARKIDADAAVRATSWGTFQVLGSTLLAVKGLPDTAVSAFDADPLETSDELLVHYLLSRPAVVAAAKAGNPLRFVELYNGCVGPEGCARYLARFTKALEAAQA